MYKTNGYTNDLQPIPSFYFNDVKTADWFRHQLVDIIGDINLNHRFGHRNISMDAYDNAKDEQTDGLEQIITVTEIDDNHEPSTDHEIDAYLNYLCYVAHDHCHYFS